MQTAEKQDWCMRYGRCGCDARVDEVFPMSVLGFNLQQEDKQFCTEPRASRARVFGAQDSVHFLPENQLCSFNLIGRGLAAREHRTAISTAQAPPS